MRRNTIKVRPAGRVVTTAPNRPPARLAVTDPVTYGYAIAALIGTAVLEDLLVTAAAHLHLL